MDTTITLVQPILSKTIDSTLTQTIDTLSQNVDALNQTLSTQSGIEIAQLIVQGLIFIILVLTACSYYKQTRLQKEIHKSQQLKTRYEMYLKTHGCVSDQEIKDFKAFPNGVIKREIYDRKRQYYAENEKIRRYLTVSKLYEFLAFIYETKQLKIPNYLGVNWIKEWTKDLLKENAFHDAHETISIYYNDFKDFINEQISKLPTITKNEFSNIEFSSPPKIIKTLVDNEVVHEKGYIINIEYLNGQLNGQLKDFSSEQIQRIVSILENAMQNNTRK
jgi:hypothetical protein